MRRKNWIFIALAVVCFGYLSNTMINVESDQLLKSIENLEEHKLMKHASWGFAVQDVETGEYIALHNADKSFRPASALKTITTATVMSLLGDSFTYKTELRHDGYIDKEGVLQGNLIIKGGGDPTLGYKRITCSQSYGKLMKTWTEAIKEAGIDSINGNVIADERFFEYATIPRNWLWEDMGNYYGAGASGLTIHENQYNLVFNPGRKQGQPTEFQYTIPELNHITFRNEVVTGGRRSFDDAYVYTAPYSNEIFMRGSVPPGKPKGYIKGAIPDPPLFAAYSLKKELAEEGIGSSGEFTSFRLLERDHSVLQGEAKTIHTTESPLLKDIVTWTNKKSLNLHCEHLLKTIGWYKYGQGSTFGGVEAIRKHWGARGVRLDKSFNMEDGSGLSPLNKVSPKQFTNILRAAAKDDNFESFYLSLSEAGNPRDKGNLKYTLAKTAAAKNLRAKSGTLKNTRCYVGYVHEKSGRLLSFAIMANDYTCKNSVMKSKLMGVLKKVAELDLEGAEIFLEE